MNILLVDDDISVLKGMEKVLDNEGYSVSSVNNAFDALKKLEKGGFDLLITDMLMPNMNGIELIKKVKEISKDMQVLVLTAFGSIENVVEAMRLGAYGYLLKPIDIQSTLLELKKIKELIQLKEQNAYLIQDKIGDSAKTQLIGRDPLMQDVLAVCKQVASSNSTVLIEGETGTGKELIASFIHYESARKEKAFIKVNCCALSEGILESELFGHEKGAFTGAIKERKGRFEIADGGTIFLDEIGDLSLSVQAKLLRFLQEREFERVGGSRTLKVDVRVIAATNKVLEKEVEKTNFRSDLFYRLNVINICLPPLRERRGDISDIAQFFLSKYALEMGKPNISISPKVIDLMEKYDWPGNVRELDNIVERCVVLCKNDIIDIKDVPFKKRKTMRGGLGGQYTFRDAVKMFEKEFIQESLKEHDYNISKTAQTIKLARTNIYEKIKRYGILLPQVRKQNTDNIEQDADS